jgi:hypothetical protein
MGNTQGVKANSRPAPRNTPMVLSRLPEASVRAMASVVLPGVDDVAADAAGDRSGEEGTAEATTLLTEVVA